MQMEDWSFPPRYDNSYRPDASSRYWFPVRETMPAADRDAAIRLAAGALAGPDRELDAAELEVAVLEGGNGRRAFVRLEDAVIDGILS